MKKIISGKWFFHIISVFLITLLSLFTMYPMIKSGILNVFDVPFHFNRFMSFSNVFTSPVNFLVFEHRGKPVSLFYPTITTYLYHLINLVVKSYIKCAKVFVWLNIFGSGIIAYLSLLQMNKKKGRSLAFAVIFMLSSYLYMNIYWRFALGEVVAYTFLPIALLGIYKSIFEDYKKWQYLPLGITLILYSHLLTFGLVVLMSIGFGIFSLFNFKKYWSIERLKYLALSVVFIIFMSLIIIIPLVEQMTYTHIHSTWQIFTFTDQVKSLSMLITNSYTNQWTNHSIGFVMFAGTLLSIVVLVINVLLKKRFFNYFETIAIIFAVILIILQTNWLPWKIFDMTSMLAMQFIYRFNMLLTILSAFVISRFFDFDYISNKYNNLIYSITLCIVILISLGQFKLSSNDFYNRLQSERGLHPITEEYVNIKLRKYHYYDYANYKQVEPILKLRINNYLNGKSKKIKNENKKLTEKNKLYNNKVLILNGKKLNEKPTFTSNEYKFTLKNNESGKLIVPINLYKGINIKVNGKVFTKYSLSKFGTLQLNVSASKVIKVVISYPWTLLARISQFVSTATWVAFIFLIFRKKNSELKKLK